MPSKLKTIKLQGKDYIQVNTRVAEFNKSNKNGKIKTAVTISDNTVWFKATITPDITKPDRYFNGHSFGQLGKEKAFEKLETVAVGRALAFMGIGIVESIASSDEMNNFNNNQKPKYDNSKPVGTCSVCGKNAIDGKHGAFCPDYKQHKADGVRWEIVTEKSDYHKKQEKALDLPTISYEDELDATELSKIK